MVVDPAVQRMGFLLLGDSESMDANQAVCRSRIENVQLAVTYTIGSDPPPAPTPATVLVSPLPGSAGKSNSCLACSAVLAPTPGPTTAPTLPDFKLMAVRAVNPDQPFPNGTTAGYEVVVANLGTRMPQISSDPSKKPQVQVSIQVTGAAQYSSMTQTPAGWDCSGTGPVTCVGPLGGYGDPIQNTVVTFRLQVLGAKSGIGAISAAADPNGLIKESDVTNNAKTLAITVR